MTNKTQNTVHKDDSVQPVGLKEKWQYLQEKVLDECIHEFPHHGLMTPKEGGFTIWCNKGCEVFVPHGTKYSHRDFFTPDDYCALEDKMQELGEWGDFEEWIWEEYNFDASRTFDLEVWYDNTRTQRAELIYEYFKQKES